MGPLVPSSALAYSRSMLALKRASKQRPGGPWSEDDYDVFVDDRHVERILWTHAPAR